MPYSANVRSSTSVPAKSARRRRAGLTSAITAILLVGSAGASWSQQRVGRAEVVINVVEGDLPSGTVPVVQSDGVFRDEGVRTHVDSKARLLLEDETNVTIGPSSTIKLDRFVYAGPKQPGTIVLNLAKGTARLIVGDANKRAYTIVTPTAAIGIRE
jgi:hypothetical protein